jgi:hypothetical protein
MRILPRDPQISRRTVFVAWALVAVLFLLLIVWLVATAAHLTDQVHETQSVNQAQDSALAEANRRLIEAGERPVPTPEPGPVGQSGDPGPVGPQGLAGPVGPRGPRGATGDVGPRGAMGRPGTDGTDGATGATGPQGPAGPAGADGTNGTDGKDGVDGMDGASPFPFTFQFTVQTNPAESTTYTVTCTADGCTVTESDNAQN